jgi:small subunit ribosomal protein S18
MPRRTPDDRRGGGSRSRREESAIPRRRMPRVAGVKEIDVNNHEFLRQFLTEHGKIVPARLSGLSASQQRKLKQGIRRCRAMGLLP